MGWQTGSGWQGLVVLPNVWPSLQSFEGGVDIRYSSVLFDRLSVNSSGNLLIQAIEKAPGACTAALAGLGAGNVNTGTHSYKVTFVTAGGETDAGAVSATVTTTAGNGQVALSAIPTGSAAVTSRKVYRTAVGNAATGPWLLLATIADNSTTTYADNTADASLTTTIPSTNTAIDTRTTLTNAGALIQPSLIGGTGAASTLTLQSTSGVGTTGADIVFKVGNNGGTEAGRILNSGKWGINTATPGGLFTINQGTLQLTGSSQVVPSAGAGVEVYYNGSVGVIQAYDRTGSAYKPLTFGGSVVYFTTGSFGLGGVTSPASLLDLRTGDLTFSGANGQKYVQGRKTELTTIAAAATTPTTITIPANAILKAVMMRVTVQPPGTATMVVTATTSGTVL